MLSDNSVQAIVIELQVCQEAVGGRRERGRDLMGILKTDGLQNQINNSWHAVATIAEGYVSFCSRAPCTSGIRATARRPPSLWPLCGYATADGFLRSYLAIRVRLLVDEKLISVYLSTIHAQC